jgi:hypothetical protein
MMRAGPPRWATAASWSGASSAAGADQEGTDRKRPASTDSARMSAAGARVAGSTSSGGPPSIHAWVPSSRVTSPVAPSAAVAPSRSALRAHHQMTSSVRAS